MNRTPERIVAFCAALAESGSARAAARAINISISAVYEWRKSDPEFAAAWDAADKVATLTLEGAAHERAIEGVREPIYHHGVLVDTVRKYSDTLTIFLLKARDPAKYRERSDVHLTGALAVTNLSDDALNSELASLLSKHTASTPSADDDELA